MVGYLYSIRTDKDVEFTGGLAQNAAEVEHIVTTSLAGVDANLQLRLRAITIVSDQNLAWELDFFSTDAGNSTDADLNSLTGLWAFATTDGSQIAGTGLWRYYIDGLDIPIYDNDRTSELHVALVNRSATAKNAGATGEIVVTFWFESMGAGW